MEPKSFLKGSTKKETQKTEFFMEKRRQKKRVLLQSQKRYIFLAQCFTSRNIKIIKRQKGSLK